MDLASVFVYHRPDAVFVVLVNESVEVLVVFTVIEKFDSCSKACIVISGRIVSCHLSACFAPLKLVKYPAILWTVSRRRMVWPLSLSSP